MFWQLSLQSNTLLIFEAKSNGSIQSGMMRQINPFASHKLRTRNTYKACSRDGNLSRLAPSYMTTEKNAGQSIRPSVRLSVCLSVCLSIGGSVRSIYANPTGQQINYILHSLLYAAYPHSIPPQKGNIHNFPPLQIKSALPHHPTPPCTIPHGGLIPTHGHSWLD